MVQQRSRLVFLISVLFWSGMVGACTTWIQSTTPTTIWPAAEWLTSSPEDQRMDSNKLNQMMELIEERDAAIDSVLVIRNGYLVFEQYRRNWKETGKHHLQSVTKSFTSTLVGVAIEQGFIESVDQRLLDFYPDRAIANLDARKQDITIKDLLTMSEGMDWHELDLPYNHPDNSLGQMWTKTDVIQFILDRPMVRDPGEAWNYNSGTSILLGNIVEQAAGQDVVSFARQYLFDPIGIGSANWDKADASHYHTDGGLYMVPRDMARLGYLMLRKGIWEGEQILPSDWVEEASTAYYQTTGVLGYGYQWWTLPQGDIYSARGHYDQAIYVIPEADLVVVFTANIPDKAIHPEDGLLIRYILGACEDLASEVTQQRYSNYGFNLDYGREFFALALPAGESGEISDSSGAVQFSYSSYPTEIFTVSWNESFTGLDPEIILHESILALVNQYGLDLEETGSSSLIIKGKQIPTEGFSLAAQGIQFTGLSGIWTCDTSDQGFLLSYFSDSEDPLSFRQARFRELFSSFECQ